MRYTKSNWHGLALAGLVTGILLVQLLVTVATNSGFIGMKTGAVTHDPTERGFEDGTGGRPASEGGMPASKGGRPAKRGRPASNEALVAIDKGDGGEASYAWADTGGNITALNATLEAVEYLDIDINYTIGEYGAFVNSIGDKENAADYSMFWMLLEWNETGKGWISSDLGASDLYLGPGDSICWYYGAWGNTSGFDPLSAGEPDEDMEEEGIDGEDGTSEKTGDNGTDEAGGDGEDGQFIPAGWYLAPVGLALCTLLLAITGLRKDLKR